MVYNKRTHIEQEVKLEERGVHQPLINIPLRSMLINAVVPLKDTRNSSEAERRLTYTSTGSRKSATRDFDLLVSYHLAYTSGFNKILCSWRSDVSRPL